MASRSLELGAAPLTLEEVAEVALSARKVVLSAQARTRVEAAHAFLVKQTASGAAIYGVNTGFGLLAQVRIPDAELASLQLNLLRSHACGMGEPLPEPQVRAMLLLRAQTLSRGHSGVRVEVIEQILALLNAGIHPVVPCQGSVGASGDLAPLAHLALPLVGESEVVYQGKVQSAAEALASSGLKPLKLGIKEGLALINGTQFMAALGTLALLDAEQLADFADAVGALTTEALQGTDAAFSEEIQAVRPHPGQVLVAARLRRFLESPKRSAIGQSHRDCEKVQDPYSLRCMPQVHGASRDVFGFVRGVLEREINAVTDNPLIFPDAPGGGKILSGGNFHGQIVAIAMDALAIASAELASISEQRIEKLINPAVSGLPPFLTRAGGLHSGLMILQVAAAAIVSENKTLCHPASVDSLPTSADKEDHVSMGAWAARKALQVVTNLRRVLAMELLAAAQGLEFARPLKTSGLLEGLVGVLRSRIAFSESDRILATEMKEIEKMLACGEFDPWTERGR